MEEEMLSRKLDMRIQNLEESLGWSYIFGKYKDDFEFMGMDENFQGREEKVVLGGGRSVFNIQRLGKLGMVWMGI